MTLADLIRGAPALVPTATGATAATKVVRSPGPVPESVARVAAVAVANPPGVISARWLLHFDADEPVVIAADRAIEHAAVLAKYPEAIAAEPLSAPMPQELPPTITAMFAACVDAGLYDDTDRPVLRAMHAADAVGTRELIVAMHSRIGRCNVCEHFARPGLSDGYCTGRDSLPHAYGFMHFLPPDGGARCDIFKEPI